MRRAETKLKEMAARQEIIYLSLHQRVSGFFARERLRSRRLQLCCDVLLSVSGDEADGELVEVAILTKKPRPKPRASQPRARLFTTHGGFCRTATQAEQQDTRFLFVFSIPVGQPPLLAWLTRPISLTPTQTPYPS